MGPVLATAKRAVVYMSDFLKLLFGLGELGCQLSNSCRDLSDPSPGLGHKVAVAREKPGDGSAKGFRNRIEALKNREAFASLIGAYCSAGDPDGLCESRDRHSRCFPCLPKFFSEYFTCSHSSLFSEEYLLDNESTLHYYFGSSSRIWMKNLKLRAGLTNQSLGEKCGFSTRQVASWLAGYGVSREGQRALARVLGPEVLLGFFLESLIIYLEESVEHED